jgi:hypothetical protein
MNDNATDERYWIAINGSGCAITALPMRNPKVTPTPQQLLGFPTYEEAAEAHRICLQAPLDEVRRLFESLRACVKSGRVRVIQPRHPQPQTDGPVTWTEDADMHQAIQRIFIKTTSN